MLVKDLRNVINNYSHEEKDKIIVELYKRIPKKVKEEYDLDNYIENIKNNEKNVKAKKEISFDELEKEIISFIKCVNLNLYATPNRVISKTERPKWRFKVKNYYKQLITYDPVSQNGIVATDLLRLLYIVLSEGTHILKFSSWNTFGAVGVSQSEFLETIVKRKLMDGITKDNMAYCADLLDLENDPTEYHVSVLLSFISCLKTVDMKYMAIEILKEKVASKKEKLKVIKKDKKVSYNQIYELETSINYYIECTMFIYFELFEVDNGITYFKKNYIEKDKEILEYILLDRLEMFEFHDEWINEYEKNMNSINYRESLKLKYQEMIKENSK